MWKKEEESSAADEQPQQRPRATPSRRSMGSSEPATIGPSITIKGEVSGDEDLLIQGRIDGSVELEEHSLTVGSEGRVKADVTGRVVTVEGEVQGDLKATEQVILRSAARVDGDITAPRVVLEDGARFRGLVDMGDAPETARGTGDRGKKAGTGSSSSPGVGSNGASKSSSSSSASTGKNQDSSSDGKSSDTAPEKADKAKATS